MDLFKVNEYEIFWMCNGISLYIILTVICKWSFELTDWIQKKSSLNKVEKEGTTNIRKGIYLGYTEVKGDTATTSQFESSKSALKNKK